MSRAAVREHQHARHQHATKQREESEQFQADLQSLNAPSTTQPRVRKRPHFNPQDADQAEMTEADEKALYDENEQLKLRRRQLQWNRVQSGEKMLRSQAIRMEKQKYRGKEMPRWDFTWLDAKSVDEPIHPEALTNRYQAYSAERFRKAVQRLKDRGEPTFIVNIDAEISQVESEVYSEHVHQAVTKAERVLEKQFIDTEIKDLMEIGELPSNELALAKLKDATYYKIKEQLIDLRSDPDRAEDEAGITDLRATERYLDNTLGKSLTTPPPRALLNKLGLDDPMDEYIQSARPGDPKAVRLVDMKLKLYEAEKRREIEDKMIISMNDPKVAESIKDLSYQEKMDRIRKEKNKVDLSNISFAELVENNVITDEDMQHLYQNVSNRPGPLAEYRKDRQKIIAENKKTLFEKHLERVKSPSEAKTFKEMREIIQNDHLKDTAQQIHDKTKEFVEKAKNDQKDWSPAIPHDDEPIYHRLHEERDTRVTAIHMDELIDKEDKQIYHDVMYEPEVINMKDVERYNVPPIYGKAKPKRSLKNKPDWSPKELEAEGHKAIDQLEKDLKDFNKRNEAPKRSEVIDAWKRHEHYEWPKAKDLDFKDPRWVEKFYFEPHDENGVKVYGEFEDYFYPKLQGQRDWHAQNAYLPKPERYLKRFHETFGLDGSDRYRDIEENKQIFLNKMENKISPLADDGQRLDAWTNLNQIEKDLDQISQNIAHNRTIDRLFDDIDSINQSLSQTDQKTLRHQYYKPVTLFHDEKQFRMLQEVIPNLAVIEKHEQDRVGKIANMALENAMKLGTPSHPEYLETQKKIKQLDDIHLKNGHGDIPKDSYIDPTASVKHKKMLQRERDLVDESQDWWHIDSDTADKGNKLDHLRKLTPDDLWVAPPAPDDTPEIKEFKRLLHNKLSNDLDNDFKRQLLYTITNFEESYRTDQQIVKRFIHDAKLDGAIKNLSQDLNNFGYSTHPHDNAIIRDQKNMEFDEDLRNNRYKDREEEYNEYRNKYPWREQYLPHENEIVSNMLDASLATYKHQRGKKISDGALMEHNEYNIVPSIGKTLNNSVKSILRKSGLSQKVGSLRKEIAAHHRAINSQFRGQIRNTSKLTKKEAELYKKKMKDITNHINNLSELKANLLQDTMKRMDLKKIQNVIDFYTRGDLSLETLKHTLDNIDTLVDQYDTIIARRIEIAENRVNQADTLNDLSLLHSLKNDSNLTGFFSGNNHDITSILHGNTADFDYYRDKNNKKKIDKAFEAETRYKQRVHEQFLVNNSHDESSYIGLKQKYTDTGDEIDDFISNTLPRTSPTNSQPSVKKTVPKRATHRVMDHTGQVLSVAKDGEVLSITNPLKKNINIEPPDEAEITKLLSKNTDNVQIPQTNQKGWFSSWFGSDATTSIHNSDRNTSDHSTTQKKHKQVGDGFTHLSDSSADESDAVHSNITKQPKKSEQIETSIKLDNYHVITPQQFSGIKESARALSQGGMKQYKRHMAKKRLNRLRIREKLRGADIDSGELSNAEFSATDLDKHKKVFNKFNSFYEKHRKSLQQQNEAVGNIPDKIKITVDDSFLPHSLRDQLASIDGSTGQKSKYTPEQLDNIRKALNQTYTLPDYLLQSEQNIHIPDTVTAFDHKSLQKMISKSQKEIYHRLQQEKQHYNVMKSVYFDNLDSAAEFNHYNELLHTQQAEYIHKQKQILHNLQSRHKINSDIVSKAGGTNNNNSSRIKKNLQDALSSQLFSDVYNGDNSNNLPLSSNLQYSTHKYINDYVKRLNPSAFELLTANVPGATATAPHQTRHLDNLLSKHYNEIKKIQNPVKQQQFVEQLIWQERERLVSEHIKELPNKIVSTIEQLQQAVKMQQDNFRSKLLSVENNIKLHNNKIMSDFRSKTDKLSFDRFKQNVLNMRQSLSYVNNAGLLRFVTSNFASSVPSLWSLVNQGHLKKNSMDSINIDTIAAELEQLAEKFDNKKPTHVRRDDVNVNRQPFQNDETNLIAPAADGDDVNADDADDEGEYITSISSAKKPKYAQKSTKTRTSNIANSNENTATITAQAINAAQNVARSVKRTAEENMSHAVVTARQRAEEVYNEFVTTTTKTVKKQRIPVKLTQ